MKIAFALIAALLPMISFARLPDKVDAVILGTGPSAVAAAIQLMQDDHSVLMVDSYGVTGGDMAIHLELKRSPVDESSPRIMQEIDKAMQACDPFHPSASRNMGHSEWIKHATDTIIERYDIPLLLHAQPQKLHLVNNRCTGLVLRLKNGVHIIKTPLVLDCTSQQKSRYLFEKSCGKQPMKACFRLRVDDVEGGTADIRKLELPQGKFDLRMTPVEWDSKECLLELETVLTMNPFCTIDISHAEITMRSVMEEQLASLKKNNPAYLRAVPIQSSLETSLCFPRPANNVPQGIHFIGDASDKGDFNVATAEALAKKLCQNPENFRLSEEEAVTSDTAISEQYQADIVVVGGGTAGLTAALQARMNGDKVILIEQYPFFGGTMVAGGVAQGAAPILTLLSQLGATEHKNWGSFNKEVMKNVMQTLVLKSGVQPLLNGQVYAVDMNGRKVRSVTLLNRHGQKCTVSARIFIDCTGDGDVAAAAGANFMHGNRSKGIPQPVAMLYYWRWLGERAEKNPIGGHISGKNVDADALDSLSFTKAEQEGRKQVMKAYREYNTAYKGQMKMIASSPQSGVRQTRQIEGDYVLTVRDLYEDIPFPDTITRCQYLIDVQGEYVEAVNPFAVPYRILLVKGIDNMLMAGRHISMAHEVVGAVRYQPSLMVIGKFAGAAAAEALTCQDNPRSIQVPALRKKLSADSDFYSRIYFGNALLPRREQ